MGISLNELATCKKVEFVAKTKEDKKRIKEGNLPEKLSVLMHLIRQYGGVVENMRWGDGAVVFWVWSGKSFDLSLEV